MKRDAAATEINGDAERPAAEVENQREGSWIVNRTESPSDPVITYPGALLRTGGITTPLPRPLA
jgi:hypothetical protein